MLERQDRLRIYPEVVAHFMRSGKIDEYILYVATKAMDRKNTGRGIVSVNDVVALAVKMFGVTKKTAYAKINAGVGLFWREPQGKRGNRTVGLLSHARIFKSVIMRGTACKPVNLALRQLGFDGGKYTGQEIRDIMTAVVAASHKNISMSNLARLTGVTYRTAQRRIQFTRGERPHSPVTHVMTRYREISRHDSYQDLQEARGNLPAHIRRRSRILREGGGEWLLVQQCANTYTLLGVQDMRLAKRHRDLKNTAPNRMLPNV